MALPADKLPDFGQLRGLSAKTLSLCGVHTVDDGWVWTTYTLEGLRAERWKSFHSSRPDNVTGWAKYRWLPQKPAGNAGYFDPDHRLREAVKANYDTLYIVGGEVAAMSMFEGGFRNSTCFFGDQNVPDSLYEDMKRLGASAVYLIPDRDESGLKCAQRVRDLLSHDLDFQFAVLALPFQIADKHGKDVNDFWLQYRSVEKFTAEINNLKTWHLPELTPHSEPANIINFPRLTGSGDLPQRFVDAILQDVERRIDPIKATRWRSDGWSQNFKCPFHDDQEPSAGFNRESMSFFCFGECGSKSAKEYGEGVGIVLKDYYDDSLGAIPKAAPIVVAAQPMTNPVQVSPAKLKTYAPPLPSELTLSESQEQEAVKARRWLDNYIRWATKGSPLTPTIFHEAMGLWLVATASTRRMKLRIAGEDIYPNLYIMIVARTSVYRKSTAMKLAYRVLNQAGLRPLLLPDDATPEALFDELAGVKPTNYDDLPEEVQSRVRLGRAVAGQRSFFKDEVSSMFSNLKKDYMHGMETFYLQGYDADTGTFERRLKSVGLITVKDPCFSFLGATTPAMFAKHIGVEERIESGMTPRFAIITPDQEMTKTAPIDDLEEPDEIAHQLGDFFRSCLPWHNDKPPSAWPFSMDVLTPPVASLSIDPEAFQYLYRYRDCIGDEFGRQHKIEDHLLAAYARLGTMAYKVAMLLAGMEATTKNFHVEARHAYAACQIVERWRESLHRLGIQVAQAANRESNDQKVLALLKQAGAQGLTMREIMQLGNLKPRSVAVEALTLLSEAGLIESVDHKPEGRGRPTTCYRVSQSD